MSLISELKRRNVVRVGFAYGVTAWLLLQMADIWLNNMEAPDWLFGAILLALAIGFPIVLISAWVFELTPEGIKRDHEVDRSQSITRQTGRKLDRVIIVILALALGYFIYDKFAPSGTGAPGDSAQQAGEGRKSIAVLPFANMSGDPANEPFTLGIHDDLLTHLSRISALKTTSRTSVLQYRDTTKTIPQIAAELGVGTILEGGIQRSGNRVRINLQLINAETDEHVWAEIYDRELTAENLFAVQGEIAGEVVKSLRATLLPEEQQALAATPTQSMAAYDLYLLGRHHWQQRTAEAMEKARDYFLAAIEEDPDYVLALSGLADSYSLLDDYGNMEGAEAYPLARAAIDHAMELDDSVSEVWASLGLLHLQMNDEVEAEEALARAIELDPQNFSAWLWYANALGNQRRRDEQMEALQTAYSLEPMYRPVINNLAYNYRARGDFEPSRMHFERLDQIDDLNPTEYKEAIADTWYWSGDQARAIAELRQILAIDPGNADAMEQLVDSYLNLGDLPEAERWAEQAAEFDTFQPVAYDIFLAKGDFDGAIEYIEEKQELLGDDSQLGYLFLLFRAAYLGGRMETARDYVGQYLGHLGGRVEINPSGTWHWNNLLVAEYLIRHGDEAAGERQNGLVMLDEISSGLTTLNQQGYHHPGTYYGLAMSRAMQGDDAGALAALGEAVDRGFRDHVDMDSEPSLAHLRGDDRYVAIRRRMDDLAAADRATLEGMTLATYTPPVKAEVIELPIELLESYAGYYSDGNQRVRLYIDEEGRFMARPPRLGREFELFPIAEDQFRIELQGGDLIQFHTGEDGAVTHLTIASGGSVGRMRAVDPPPPAIELDRSVIERYEGLYAAQLVAQAQGGAADTDTWTGRVSVDEDGVVWLDFDNQPALTIVPYAETEFFVPGFIQRLRFETDPSSGEVNRFTWIGDGNELEFIRQ